MRDSSRPPAAARAHLALWAAGRPLWQRAPALALFGASSAAMVAALWVELPR